MRILLDPGVHSMGNKGILAMLQVEVARLKKLWPNAVMDVIAESPHVMKYYLPNCHPVSPNSDRDWSSKRRLFNFFHRIIPKFLIRFLLDTREKIQQKMPYFQFRWFKELRAGSGNDKKGNQKQSNIPKITVDTSDMFFGMQSKLKDNHDLWQALNGTDLFVAAGGGYMCDAAKPFLLKVLSRMGTAIELGKTTVMVGQGIGPLDDVELRSKLQAILPLVDLILVRERRVSFPILESLGVSLDRVMMTGDDAIELVYRHRNKHLDHDIGINIRVASHTLVDQKYIEVLRPILIQAAYNLRAKLVGLPIAWTIENPDNNMIRHLAAGYDDVIIDRHRFETPLELIKKAGRCRIVITGAFHSAVFALAQGIPVIALVKSIEYDNKLSGLRDEFGNACQIIHLDDEKFTQILPQAIDLAWNSACEVRTGLLLTAERQINLGYAGYKRLYDLVTGKL